MGAFRPEKRGSRRDGARRATGPVLIVVGCISILIAFSIDTPNAPAVERQTELFLLIEGGLSICCGLGFVVNMSNGLEHAVRFLQPLVGKPESLVRRYCGAPCARSEGPDGVLLTWRSPEYQITLLFQNGTCQGIVREGVPER